MPVRYCVTVLSILAIGAGWCAERTRNTEYDERALRDAWKAAADQRAQMTQRFMRDQDEAYQRFLQECITARRAFNHALVSNDLAQMDVQLRACETAFAGLQQVYGPHGIPAALPTVAPPSDLRAAFAQRLFTTRSNWIARLDLNAQRARALRGILEHDELPFHTALLEAARTNQSVTLAWLAHIYGDLVQQQPCTLVYWYGLGNAWYLQGRIRAANRVWHRAVLLFPDSLYVHFQLARTCSDEELDTKRAVAHLRWIIANTDARAWLCRAQAQLARRLLRLKRYKETLDAAERSVAYIHTGRDTELLPAYVDARRSQCTALLELGDLDRAAAALVDAAGAMPHDQRLQEEVADLYYTLATAQENVNKSYADKALLWLDRAGRESARPARILVKTAHLRLRLNQLDLAEQDAVRALALEPDSPSVLTTLGYVYLTQHRHDAAVLLFRKALDLDSSFVAAREGLLRLDADVPTGAAP